MRALERLLLVTGVVCLGYWGYVSVEAALYQAYETRELEAILASGPVNARPATGAARLPADGSSTEAPSGGTSGRVAQPRVSANVGSHVDAEAPSAIGRIEIPRLGVNAIVRAGSDARTLRLAVGHIPGTAAPGFGNTGLAAHRDTFFRRLGSIAVGDEIRVVTPGRTYRYAVEETMIVEPTDVWVLDPTNEPVLTLVTCYPFRFIGSAPQRFIVRAVMTSS